jgi:AhpD family alkylhydroperoxidase
MQRRLDYSEVAPGSVQAMYKLQKYVEESGLERSLLELVKTRVSQINGCAYCIDMHTKDARGHSARANSGSTPKTPFYTDRERAALGWAEAITLISQSHASDEEFEAVRAQFSEEELVKLTMAIIAINGWNRLAIAFRETAGTYQPHPVSK